MPFSSLGLSETILANVAEQGYSEPTPIQEQAIPVILAGKDLLACAQTGSGKTASFVLPILEQLKDLPAVRAKRIQALIITPTRELAVQVEENIQRYAKHLNLSSMAMYGGIDSEPQKQRLIEGIDILVATPGRLLDMAHQRAVHFDGLKVLVLDEADRMLDMGFIADINKIIERLPEDRQSLLFSATLPSSVRQLAKTSLPHAVEISATPASATTPEIDQWLVTVDKAKKSALLSHLITENQWQQALIFIRTKHGAAKLVSQLDKRGIKADSIHGDRSQAVRERILADFKAGDIGFLVATGIASRGIDIADLDRVINYDLPDDADDYIHRIGRTGRAGSKGEAVSLVSNDDFRRLCAIESRLGHVIQRNDIEAFAAQKEVPVSILNYVPKHKRAAIDLSANKPAKKREQGAKNHASKSQRKNSPNPRARSDANSGSKSDGNKPDPWGKWKR